MGRTERLRGMGPVLALCSIALALSAAGCRGQQEPARPGQEVTEMKLVSSAFADGEDIPAEHAMREVTGGKNISVPYEWSDVPKGTRSFALLVIDTSPVARKWVHWMVADIPSGATRLEAGASGSSMPEGSRELVNGFGDLGWGGPRPPAGTGAHSYVATIYALDVERLELAEDTRLPEFLAAVSGHTLAEARYTGTFAR